MSYDSLTQTYTLHRLTSDYTRIYIYNNCTLEIPEDTTLINQGYASTGAGSGTLMYLYEGGKLICRPGSRIKFSQSGGYITMYGIIQAIGTQVKPIIFQGYRTLYCYHKTYETITTYQYVTFKNNSYSTGYFLSFSQYNTTRAPIIRFKNIKITNDSGNNGYGFYFSPGGMYANVQVDGFQISYIYLASLIYGSSVKLKNGKIHHCTYNPNVYIQGGGNVVSVAYQTSKIDDTFPTGRFQSMVVLQNVQFDNLQVNQYGIYAFYNSLVYIKNCKFSLENGSPMYRGIYSLYGSVVIQNDNDYTDIISNTSRKIWGSNATFLHGHQLNLTVLDQNNNYVKQAIVSIIHNSNPSKERWAGLTDVSGSLLTVYGDNPVFIQKQQSSLDTFIDWSSSTDGHKMSIYKQGYEVYQQILNFTQDLTRVINLSPKVQNTNLPGLQIGQGISL